MKHVSRLAASTAILLLMACVTNLAAAEHRAGINRLVVGGAEDLNRLDDSVIDPIGWLGGSQVGHASHQ